MSRGSKDREPMSQAGQTYMRCLPKERAHEAEAPTGAAVAELKA